MAEYTTEALRAWFRRAEPLYPELFNAAHAICGNTSQAEDALKSGLLEVWSESGEGGMGLREKLKGAIRTEALRLARANKGDIEMTWPGYSEDDEDPLIRLMAREDIDTQRILTLRYGIGLSAKRISALTGLPAGYILRHFDNHCKRQLSAAERSKYDILMRRTLRQRLRDRTSLPHPAQIYRGFEAEVGNLRPPARRVSRIVYQILVLIMALICAILFWLFAVLVQPPTIASVMGFL